MALQFPTSPSVNDTYLNWYWNGEAWKLTPTSLDPRELHGHYSFTGDSSAPRTRINRGDGFVLLSPTVIDEESALPTTMAAYPDHWIDAGKTGFSFVGAPLGSFANISLALGVDHRTQGSSVTVELEIAANSASGNAIFSVPATVSVPSSGTVGDELVTASSTIPMRSFLIGDSVASAGYFKVKVSSTGPVDAYLIKGEYQFFL